MNTSNFTLKKSHEGSRPQKFNLRAIIVFRGRPLGNSEAGLEEIKGVEGVKPNRFRPNEGAKFLCPKGRVVILFKITQGTYKTFLRFRSN